ncbi:MAG TPA: MotA/TolQ/ExbB proton channel family protein [Phycisphaerae bacterium]|nr:MotA/TolQ/ExbB proton channel family protein [Phycisphaerae bacterium]
MSSLPLNHTPRGAEPIHRDRHLIPILVGIIGFFVVLGIAQSIHTGRDPQGGGVHAYNFLIVCLAPLAMLAAVYGWAGVVDAFCWIVRRPTRGTSAREAVTFFQLGAAFAMAVGCLNTLVGLVLSLTDLTDTQRLGSGIALALLSQLYGVFVAVTCIAVAAYIARRHRETRVLTPLARRAASVAGLTIVAGTLTTLLVFGILMLSAAPGL